MLQINGSLIWFLPAVNARALSPTRSLQRARFLSGVRIEHHLVPKNGLQGDAGDLLIVMEREDF